MDLSPGRRAISPKPFTYLGGAVTDLSRHIRSLRRYAERSGAQLECKPLPTCVHGRTCRDRITLSAHLAPEQELAALVHELAHWLVHRPDTPSHECTLYEYEAEAVETLVLERLGAPTRARACDPLEFYHEQPTDGLLAVSVTRVRFASSRLLEEIERDASETREAGETVREGALEPQPAVNLEAATREEIVLKNEAHGVSDFLGFTQPL